MNIYCEYEKLIKKNKINKKLDIKTFKKANNTTISEINLLDEHIAKKFNKKCGTYITICCEDFDYLSNNCFSFLTNILTEEIKKILKKLNIDKINYPKYFIVGLGNSEIKADCIGVYSSERIISTYKDIQNNTLSKKHFENVFSIAPSISNKNGIYTYDIIKSLTNSLKPDIVILIDSLSCINAKNLFKTFQLNTVGLTPGCEIGNKQPTINTETLSVPVISIGCPTVINLQSINKKEKNNIVFTLKDVDIAINKCSDIISFSLNKAIHKNLTSKDIIFLTKK